MTMNFGTNNTTSSPTSKKVKRRRVLIMDDESLFQNLLSDLLSFFGFEVSVANHGEEACDLYTEAFFSGEAYDLVILDLSIPDGLGAFGTIKHLSAIDPDIKAIISSGYTHDPMCQMPLKYGFVGCLLKPFNLDQLQTTLSEIMDN